MAFAAPFEGPRQLINRARRRADELEADISTMASGLTMHFLETHSEGTLKQYVLQFSDQPSIDMSLTLRESLNNLRVALDIVVCDAALLHGFPAEKMDQLKFPFGMGEAGLKDSLKRMKLPADIENLIWSIHPARVSQQKWIRDLHDLDILSKHRIILPVNAASPGFPPIILPDYVKSALAEAFGLDLSNVTSPWTQGSIVALPAGVDPRSVYRPKGPVELRLPHKMPFGGESVVPLLRFLAANVEALVQVFFDMFSPDGNPSNRQEIRTAFGLP